MTTFEHENGFRRDSVHLGNWRSSPWNVWAFRNIPELIPTARIEASPGTPEEPAHDPSDLSKQEFEYGGERRTIAEALRQTYTDALVVTKAGKFVADFHAPNVTLRSRHILFSTSKSVTGILAGMLIDDGLLDPEESVAHYVPELERSAFGDATVRHVLDMRTSLSFNEDYLDPQGDFARYRRAGLLDPAMEGSKQESVIQFLASLKKGKSDHGGPFHYCSPNSDVLGLVVERASGRRFPDLVSERLWRPLRAREDAYITVDAAGTPRAGGGLFMTARDFARVGELMRLNGTMNGRRMVAAEWVRDTISGGSREAWQTGSGAYWLPDGRYRNQWYQLGDILFALGIHGQWLYVNPKAETVIAKFSSQPEPINNPLKHLNLALFAALSTMV